MTRPTRNNVLFMDLETHNAGRQYGMEPQEFVRLMQYAWGRTGEVKTTTDYDEMIGLVESSDLVVGHNHISFDLPALYGKDSIRPLELALDRRVWDSFVAYPLRFRVPYYYNVRGGKKGSTIGADGKQKPAQVKKFLALDNLAFQHDIDGKLGNLQDLAKKYNPPKTLVADLDYSLIPLDDPDFLGYAEQDVIVERDLACFLMDRQGISDYEWREMLILSIKAQMTRNGFTVDVPAAQARVDELAAKREKTMNQLVEEYDFPTEGKSPWASNKGKEVIMAVLADHGITPESRPDWERTKTNNISLGGEELIRLTEGTAAADFAEALAVLKGQRTLAQLALESVKEDGKAHPQMTSLQRSGRFSMTGPSLPIWGSRTDALSVDKRYFIASPGCKLVAMDYSNCFGLDCRVLTSDLRWVNVADLSVGDELIGFDEDVNCRTGKMRRTTVTHVEPVTSPTVEIEMDNGDVLTSSAGHLWPIQRKVTDARYWSEAKDIKPGDYLTKWAGDPWDEATSFEDGWMSGMLDGEGWLSVSEPASRTGTTNLGVAQNRGPVADRLKAWLDENNVAYSRYVIRDGTFEQFIITSTRDKLRVLGTLRPTRLIGKHPNIWEGRRPFNPTTDRPRVKEVRVVGEQPLISVGTSTHTLVVDGYLTHNCDQRIVAALSGDENYAKRFEPGADGHEISGRLMFGDADYDTDPKEKRTIAKALSHAFAYGAGAKTLARSSKLPEELEPLKLAYKFIDAMNTAYPKNKWWREDAYVQGQTGWITNDWGRRMPVDKDRSFTQSPGLLGQSGTREIMCDRLISIAAQRPNVLRWLVATVHDEVIWDIPETELGWAVPWIKENMETTFQPKHGGQPIYFPVGISKPSDTWEQASHD